MSTASQTAAALYTKVSANAGFIALAKTRLYPLTVPQGAVAPYAVFQQVNSDPDRSSDGPAGATHRMYQFACFAATYEGALALRDAVITALDCEALSTGEKPGLEDERDGELDDAVDLYRADADFLI